MKTDKKRKKITVLGGGTGTFVVLSGLKRYDDLSLSVIVSMTDSGGSTGKLRDQLGVLPPGDLRQCLLALSEASMNWRKLFLYRFDSGDLKGHNFGNIFLAALEKICFSYDEVVNFASILLKTKGEVIPVTKDKTHLVAYYENGKVVEREGLIDENKGEKSKIKKLSLKPNVFALKKAVETIKKSDFLVIGPGDLYTSIIPVLLPIGIVEAVKCFQGKIIYIMNLMTKAGQTYNYKASDHLRDLEKYLKRKIDIILINNEKINQKILNIYQKYDEIKVVNDLEKDRYKIIETDLLDNREFKKDSSDILYRSILRHDSNKLARVLIKIFYA